MVTMMIIPFPLGLLDPVGSPDSPWVVETKRVLASQGWTFVGLGETYEVNPPTKPLICFCHMHFEKGV